MVRNIVEKNQELIVKIEDNGNSGEGIAKADGYPLFIKDAIRGDVARVKVTKTLASYGYARLMDILEPSPDRVPARCPNARRCGGCQIQEMSCEAQLKYKERKVLNALVRIGKIDPERFFAVPTDSEENKTLEDRKSNDSNPIFHQNRFDLNEEETEKSDSKDIYNEKYACSETGDTGKQKSETEFHKGATGKDRIIFEPIIGMKHPWRYRNKAQFPVGRDPADGSIATGFYAERTHALMPVNTCLLNHEKLDRAAAAVRDYMEQSGAAPYDETTGKGLIRHVLARCGFHTGQLMVCLVINGTNIPKPELLIRRLQQIEGLTSVSLNINKEKTNVILGKTTRHIYGPGYITDEIGGVKFQISPQSFYQVNPVQTEKLYGKALEYAGLTGRECVWDLYCGIGTISLFLAKRARKVYGIEIVPQAIEDAKKNAALNGITNVEFFVGKAEEEFAKFAGEMAWNEEGVRDVRDTKTGVNARNGKNENDGNLGGNEIDGENKSRESDGKAEKSASPEVTKKAEGKTPEKPDVVVVDPPRKGCDEKLLAAIVSVRPERVVYVSCDPATLARDVRYLTEHGYELKKVQPVDQFSQSFHVETIVQLSQQKPDDYVEIDLDLDELDATSAELKATYEEIKAYVWEEFGLKVSNLYISQTKRKYGLEVGECYNHPKTPDAKVPQCPPEKESAIRSALEHFAMI